MNAARSFLLVAALGAASPAVFSAPPVWSWHQAGMEILSPRFSPDGREIAFSFKRHEIDGGESVGMSEDRLKKYRAEHEAAIRSNPRAFDPSVNILTLKTGKLQAVGFGYSPAFSPDGQRIAFEFQKQPISGFRALASTLEGNEIWIYERQTATARAAVIPLAGSVALPEFSPDGKSLIFANSEAVNGSFSGPVGVGKLDIEARKVTRLYAPRRSHGLPHIVNQYGYVGDSLYAIVSIPQEPGIHMANSYLSQLFSLEPHEESRFSWGIAEFFQNNPTFGRWRDGKPAVFAGTWQPLSSAKITSNRRAAGVLSPDGRWVAREFASGIVVTDAVTGAKVADFAGPRSNDPETIEGAETSDGQSLEGITWSADSRRIAWVELVGYFTWDYDVLKVATMPESATGRSPSTH